MITRLGYGEGSSSGLWGDTLAINWDHEADSFVVALDKHTGEERWRRERPGELTSWSTPAIHEHEGRVH
jgi:outer membrane protein assembly factor BamB